MPINDIILLVLVGAAVITVVGLLIWKNRKDRKAINPDAADATEEMRMDRERNHTKI
jgi:hypothetical protein